MRRRFFTLLIVFVMLLTPILTSCSDDEEALEKPAVIYTLYTICDDGTTQEAIKEVELALNRLTFNQLGFNIKLFMVPESEYDQLIADTYAEIEAYEEAKKTKPTGTVSSSGESSAPITNDDILTGEEIIQNLENGIEIELNRPRLDIFLVRGYDNYINLVANNQLAALDEKLNSEAKNIKVSVFTTFLTAAKVPSPSGARKTYGVPMNKGIGQYEYIVFDSEYLDKYQFDASTMKSLTDLESFLKIIKENEPDVVPLANIFDANNISYIFTDGFPAYVNSNNAVINGYKNKPSMAMLNYFTMVSRYYSLGYLIEDQPEKDFAVKFVSGTFEDLENLEKTTGRKYESIVYSYPEPTNEDLLENLFCVSKYTVTNELTDVAEILEFLLTNSRPANLLTYGVENIHYTLNNDNQVVRLNNDYLNNQSNTGNAFLTYTLAGENKDKWQILKNQNIDSNKNLSPTIGFIYYPNEFANPDVTTLTITEPDYSRIVLNALPQHYAELISGRAGYISPSDLQSFAEEQVMEEILESTTTLFTNNLLNRYSAEINGKYVEGAPEYDAIVKASFDAVFTKLATTANKNAIKKALREEVVKELGEGATDTEITELVNERFTTEYINSQLRVMYSEEKIEEERIKLIDATIKDRVEKALDALLKSDEYQQELADLLASKEFDDYVQNEFDNTSYYHYQQIYTTLILEKVTDFCGEVLDDLSEKIEAAYNQFLDDYIEFLAEDGFEYNGKTYSKTVLNKVVDKLLANDKSLKTELELELRASIIAEFQDKEDRSPTGEELEAYMIDRGTDAYYRTAALPKLSSSLVVSTYNEMVVEYARSQIGLEIIANSSEEEEEEPLPSDGDELSFYDLFFQNRVALQYEKFNPTATS